jgi:hypothetical protein
LIHSSSYDTHRNISLLIGNQKEVAAVEGWEAEDPQQDM